MMMSVSQKEEQATRMDAVVQVKDLALVVR